LPQAGAAPGRGAHYDFDVALLGGGLSLLLAPLLAERGLSVVVIERGTAGMAHREWNASADELQALCACGLLDDKALAQLILARYRHGICRWHGGGTYPVPGVLDCAVDATGLLALARQRAEAAGVTLMQNRWAGGERAGADGVTVGLWPDSPQRPTAPPPTTLAVRVLLDGRGVQSPYATADLMCPTVGGVLQGLEQGEGPRQIDPSVGEILVTTEGVQQGRQHLWEGFPGRAGETTVYLFYYAQRQDIQAGALAALYRRFAAQLSVYKTGRPTLVRPTFGFIPGWSRLTPAPRAPHPNIVLVGDAAARQSPLTFCGFGGMLRSLGRIIATVEARLAGQYAATCAVDDRPLHTGTGALAQLMATPATDDPQRLNALLNAAFATLHAMGPEPYAALLQDRMALPTFVRFLHRTSRRHPAVWREVQQGLGIGRAARWSLGLAGAALQG
jgi:lycopene cyclase CruA